MLPIFFGILVFCCMPGDWVRQRRRENPDDGGRKTGAEGVRGCRDASDGECCDHAAGSGHLPDRCFQSKPGGRNFGSGNRTTFCRRRFEAAAPMFSVRSPRRRRWAMPTAIQNAAPPQPAAMARAEPSPAHPLTACREATQPEQPAADWTQGISPNYTVSLARVGKQHAGPVGSEWARKACFLERSIARSRGMSGVPGRRFQSQARQDELSAMDAGRNVRAC